MLAALVINKQPNLCLLIPVSFSWVSLDKCSTVHIFSSPALLGTRYFTKDLSIEKQKPISWSEYLELTPTPDEDATCLG